MDATIGSTLGNIVDLTVQRLVSNASKGSTPTEFAKQLDASFRARAICDGLTLPDSNTTPAIPASTPASTVTGTDATTVDELWAAAQRRELAAGRGPGDALLKSLSDTADARADRRRGGGRNALDFLM